jgi:hypothetical protein
MRSTRRLWRLATLPLTVAFAGGPGAASGQAIEGTVRHQQTGDPLPGVLVSVLSVDGGRLRAVLTDDSGRFALDVPAGSYTLRAERIGLRTSTTEAFELRAGEPREEQIEMSDRAVEIAGLVVDSRLRACRLDAEGATRIQRWWSEVSTALNVRRALRNEQLGPFLVERFQREWNLDVDEVIASSRSVAVSRSNRPFVSVAEERLAEDGFVVGAADIGRTFFAPDAEVLLSDVFLSQHCFSLVEDGGRDRQIGLRFEPLEDRDVTDIAGTFWVDTVTAELRDMDFGYTNLEGPEAEAAGGRVAFRYLASGAWIVSDWHIRMPKIGARAGSSRLRTVGYVDAGGVVIPLSSPAPTEALGRIRGIVADSLRGGVLPGAIVTILGTSRQTTTAEDGSFWFFDVPEGTHYVSFAHRDLTRWGLDPGYVRLEVREGETASADLAVPSFEQAALALCLGAGVDAEALVVGRLVGTYRVTFPDRGVLLSYGSTARRGGAEQERLAFRTDSSGRFVACSIPAGEMVTVSVDLGNRWSEVADFFARDGELTYREIRIDP